MRFFFFFNDTATTEIYTLSLHDALRSPVIMQSAYVFDSDMEAAKEAGASGFITKPINLKVLKNTISQYCPSIVW